MIIWMVKMSTTVMMRIPALDSDVDEDELLGAIADVSIPGGHLDDSVALAVPPGEDIL